ncbi:MAE_28990/MAE_18760 family HEPN-like nuclease [Streptomyces hygroscopicus]|uniref:MAE_28990/MAE_18760 family HEPN-like nuclease n=1 Tax=Streptomyces hygroscopicus TaxID=1912 RepID=UPI0007676058|nr:MAE_28990/MAE_18760 family HEPN-like nuclease [Streptomyces hygroscopicus]
MAEPALESYSEFIDSLREVETLLAARPTAPLGSGSTASHTQERELVNAITRACVVMLVAHFEGFVKAALTELIDEICQAKPPARRLPEGLLELHTRERLQEIFGTEGPDRIHRTRRLFTTYAQLWDADRAVNPQLLSAKLLTRQFTNAKPEILEAVFSLLDVNDVITEADSHVNAAILARGDGATSLKVNVKLTEIVERRNKIAHGDRAEKPTPFEVESYMVFVKDLAQCISFIVERRIQHCCSLR